MTDDQSNNLNEKIFDAMLKVAFEEAVNQELASYPSDEELNKLYPPSAAFNKRIMKIIAKHERASKRKQAARSILRVAAAIGIFFTVSTFILMSVEASRVFLLNAIINMHDEHVVLEFRDNEDNVTDNVRHIPGDFGFDYVGSHAFDNLLIATYVNAVGEQIIWQQHISGNLRTAIDTAYREFSTITLNNQDAFLFESTDDEAQHIIIWERNRIVFQIFTNTNIEQALAIAEALMSYSE